MQNGTKTIGYALYYLAWLVFIFGLCILNDSLGPCWFLLLTVAAAPKGA